MTNARREDAAITMRIGVQLGYAGGFKNAVERIVEVEKVGGDVVFVAEAYSYDAVSQLGYLAARTRTIELGTGVVPIFTRTPSLLAMTAAGLDYVSDGRFSLGIGTSGPQVVEGFHGVAFDAPLGRTREVVDICRQVWRRKLVMHQGRRYQIPLSSESSTGLGKPLKLINHPVRERIPITIAAIGPKNVELAAEIAEGWHPVFFYPEKAELVWGESLAAGFTKRDATLGELNIVVARRWPSATTSTIACTRPSLNWLSTSVAWARRAAISTTTWRRATGTALPPIVFRSSTWRDVRMRPLRQCRTIWSATCR